MTTVQAHEFLTANYPEELVRQYLEEVRDEYPNEDDYWSQCIVTEEKLRHDMDLFVEASV